MIMTFSDLQNRNLVHSEATSQAPELRKVRLAAAAAATGDRPEGTASANLGLVHER